MVIELKTLYIKRGQESNSILFFIFANLSQKFSTMWSAMNQLRCNTWAVSENMRLIIVESLIALQRFGDLFGPKFNTFFLIAGFGNFVVVCGFHLWFFFDSLSKLRHCESMVVWWINDQDTRYFEGLVIGSLYISLFDPGINVGNAISSVIILKGLMKVVTRVEIVTLLLRCWVHVPTEFWID
jgi:hypothetical protein